MCFASNHPEVADTASQLDRVAMRQTWRRLTFLHWPYPPDLIRRFIPRDWTSTRSMTPHGWDWSHSKSSARLASRTLLARAKLIAMRQSLFEDAGLAPPQGAPLVHYSAELAVKIGRLI